MVPAPDVPTVPGPSRFDAARTFFLKRLAGRLLIAGSLIKLVAMGVAAAGLPASWPLQALSRVGGLTLAVGLGIIGYKLVLVAKHRLLWRVRRKLILSYIFIGFVPAILIVTFFVLIGLLLFANLSTYLIRAELRELASDATLAAKSAALEMTQANGPAQVAAILARRQAAGAAAYPGFSLAVVPVAAGRCDPKAAAGGGPGSAVLPPPRAASTAVPAMTAGPWRHLDPPGDLPAWVPCTGFSGVLAYTIPGSEVPAASPDPVNGPDDVRMVVRVVTVHIGSGPGYALVADVPVTDAVKARVREETTIDVGRVSLVPGEQPTMTLRGHAVATSGAAPPAGAAGGYRFPWVAFLDCVDWGNGAKQPLPMQIGMSVADIYGRLSSSQGTLGRRTFSDLVMIGLLVVAVLFLIIEAGALGMGFALAKSITGSVHELAAGTERVRKGDFVHRIAVSAQDQLGELADSFNSMTASIEDLLRQQQEKKRLEEEMRLAREIQMSLLPRGPLSSAGLDLTALCVPAREVGGDYYDVLPLADGRTGVLIADVSGKGMSAALYMAELKGLILSLSQIHQSPRELLISANRIISEHLDSRSFITMTYAVFDSAAGTMTWARAGHTPLIFMANGNGAGRHAQLLVPDGMVLGLRIDNGERFESLLCEETLALSPGDLLVFFTDGISEAMNADSDCFGESRLTQLIEEHGHLPFEELRERILREIDAFVGGAPQHDDMTMILVKVDRDQGARQQADPASAASRQ